MAQYFYRIDDAELGPVSFAELTAKLGSGEVRSDTPVRSDNSHDWTIVEEIPGLMRAAKKRQPGSNSVGADDARPQSGSQGDVISDRRKKTKPSESGPKVQSHLPSSDELPRAQPSRSLSPSVLVTLAVICLTTVAAGWWIMQPNRFPQPSKRVLTAGTELPLEDMTAPAPDSPTFDIPAGVPVPVPGLEAELGVSSPGLTANLTKIVYLKVTGRQDDIYLAERSTKDAAFQKPVRLKCSTSANEQFCSLSPNGQQLLFTVQGQLSKLHFATSADDFATSKPVQIVGIDAANDNVDNVQWLSETEIRFAVGDSKYTRRSQHVAEFKETSGVCRVTAEITMQNPWPRMYFSSKLDRAYFANATGISITAPKVQKDEFGMGLMLFDPTEIGPIDESFDDPVFVVPQQDVIFFTGPGKSAAGKSVLANRMWMIRI